jgi:D-glycero-D-manno-heptose 1,7-bisphosphate phosphatase
VRAVFLDRDGVINENRNDHVKNWSEFCFLPGACDAIAQLSQAGFPVFVITNQAVINRGLVSPETLADINRRMVREIEARGGRIRAIAFCPHRPDEGCSCRKPRPGLLLRLAREHDVALRSSLLVGDALSDIEAGQAVGCETTLVLTGRGREELSRAKLDGRNGFRVATDLKSAVRAYLSHSSVLVPAESGEYDRAS